MAAQDLTYFAQQWADTTKKIGIAQPARMYHFLAVGRTGTGKSSLLLSKIVQDIQANRGLALLDPHGDLAEAVLPFIPRKRIRHLVYLNPADLDFPVGLNPLERTRVNDNHLIADNLVTIFQKIWADSWGPRMAYILRNALLALLENPGSTLLSLTRLLADQEFRNRIVKNVSDPFVRYFWEHEFARYPERMLAEAVSPIQNKIGAYLANRPLRNILGQVKSSIDLHHIMDNGHILIVNLGKGRLGAEAANLLGCFILSSIIQNAMGRANIPELQRRPFIVYADEFHNLTTKLFVSALSEVRKYKCGLVLANQYLGQLDPDVMAAVLANVGTLAVFRVGVDDAEVFAKEFGTDWPVSNLVNLSPFEIFYKLLQQGKMEGPFQAVTLPPPVALAGENYVAELIDHSRRRYGRLRAKVEAKIEYFFRQNNHRHTTVSDGR